MWFSGLTCIQRSQVLHNTRSASNLRTSGSLESNEFLSSRAQPFLLLLGIDEMGNDERGRGIRLHLF